MSIIEKPKKLLLAFLEAGLKLVNSGLGDRSKYVGSSDVGQCPKKSYFAKFNKIDYSLKQLIIFMRGHVAEGIVREGLMNNSSKIKFSEQVEVQGKGEISFIRSHIDFVVEFPNELLVIECKSISSSLPNNQPRESWVLQTILQMGLLKSQTGRSVRGKIIAINLNTGETEEFDVVWSKALFDVAVDRAQLLWNAMTNKIEPNGEISELCAFCPIKNSCEKLRSNGVQIPKEVELAAMRYKDIEAQIKKLQADSKAIKGDILGFMEAANIKKLNGSEITISYSERKGRDYFSMDELKRLYPQVAKEITETSKPSKVLRIV